jgi:hypothetical protein
VALGAVTLTEPAIAPARKPSAGAMLSNGILILDTAIWYAAPS